MAVVVYLIGFVVVWILMSIWMKYESVDANAYRWAFSICWPIALVGAVLIILVSVIQVLFGMDKG